MWSVSYGDRLGIREPTQHAQCGVCIRHRLLIRKLSDDRNAREFQVKEYEAHLRRQYADRVQYWASRSASRLQLLPSGKCSISLITDGMDHSKFRFPRSKIFQSKELSGFLRPCLDASAVIAHGHSLNLYISEPYVRKDSSWCTEILSHSLHTLQVDLRQAELLIQSDNCCRETKNNTLMRWASLLTALHRVARIEFRFLSTGHSHEDVDQFFSSLSNMLERHSELPTPNSFVDALSTWLMDGSVRPHEPVRCTRKVDSVRDWLLACNRF